MIGARRGPRIFTAGLSGLRCAPAGSGESGPASSHRSQRLLAPPVDNGWVSAQRRDFGRLVETGRIPHRSGYAASALATGGRAAATTLAGFPPGHRSIRERRSSRGCGSAPSTRQTSDHLTGGTRPLGRAAPSRANSASRAGRRRCTRPASSACSSAVLDQLLVGRATWSAGLSGRRVRARRGSTPGLRRTRTRPAAGGRRRTRCPPPPPASAARARGR